MNDVERALRRFDAWCDHLSREAARPAPLFAPDVVPAPVNVSPDEAVSTYLRRYPHDSRHRAELLERAEGRLGGDLVMDREKWATEQAGPGWIRAFHVESFKSFGSACLKLSPLTLLVGPNASGKSNLIEAIRVLSYLTQNERLNLFFLSRHGDYPDVRGGLQDLPRDGRERFGLGCDFRSPQRGPWTRLRVTVNVGGEKPAIEEETIEDPEHNQLLYHVDTGADVAAGEMEVVYHSFGQGGPAPRIACSNQQLALTQLRTPARFAHTHRTAQRVIPRVARELSDALSQVFFLDPDPHRMTGYARVRPQPLMADGANLSGVLHHLCEGLGRKDRVLEFIRDLPEQEILDLSFIETESSDVKLRVTESFGGQAQRRDAAILSAGTLRVLAVAAAVLSVPERSVVVIEEIDSGIHPSRAKALLERILRVATERALSVLLTSHNPALLDALPIETIPHVACCYRDPDDGSSRIVHLGDYDRYAELLARGPVGRLMAKGILERFLRDPRTAEQRKEDALRWIAAQQGDGR